jgi:hypothetical protein
VSDRKNFAEDIKPLKYSPSPALWDIEIRKLLRGVRAHIVRRHGGAQAYIELIIAESANADIARSTFNEALRNFVQEWQTAKPENEYYISSLLDLLIAYTPAAGSVKLLAHINQWGRFGKNVFIEGKTSLDLHFKALHTLQKYFPLGSQNEGAGSFGLRAYVGILKSHLSDPAYRGHALRRLIELDEVTPLSPEVLDAIKSDIEVLCDIIPPFLAPIKRAIAKNALALLYFHGLASGEDVNEQFRQAAKNCRARFEEGQNAPIIYTEDGEEIEFFFTPEQMESYSRFRLQQTHQQEITQLVHGLPDQSDIDILTSMIEAKLGVDAWDLEDLEEELESHGYHFMAPALPVVAPAVPTIYLPSGEPVPLSLQPSALDRYLLLHFSRDQNRLVQSFREKIFGWRER